MWQDSTLRPPVSVLDSGSEKPKKEIKKPPSPLSAPTEGSKQVFTKAAIALADWNLLYFGCYFFICHN